MIDSVFRDSTAQMLYRQLTINLSLKFYLKLSLANQWLWAAWHFYLTQSFQSNPKQPKTTQTASAKHVFTSAPFCFVPDDLVWINLFIPLGCCNSHCIIVKWGKSMHPHRAFFTVHRCLMCAGHALLCGFTWWSGGVTCLIWADGHLFADVGHHTQKQSI